MSKEKTSWNSIKTNFARTKHKVLATFGAAETTVDSKIVAEKEKLFTLFKLMKRLNKNVDKYEATLKEINILQNEISHDLLALNENDPAINSYKDVSNALEQERIRIEEILENYYHDPLRVYLSQFRDIRSRLEELDVRRLDMDRYYRDYNIKANKGKDASSLQKTENKHTRTKEAYQELSDEIMRDMYALFDDRKAAFDPAFACFINKNNEYFARAAAEYQKALPYVESINEYNASTHPQAITPIEASAMSKNVRSSSVFASPKEYSSNNSSTSSTPNSSRARASTIATPTSSTSSYQSPPVGQYDSPVSQYDHSPQDTNTYSNNNSSVNLSKPNYRASTTYSSPTPQHQPPQTYQPPHQPPQTYQPPHQQQQQQDEVPYYSPPSQHQQQPTVNLYKPTTTTTNTSSPPNLYKNNNSPPHSPVNTSTTNNGAVNTGRPLPTPIQKPRSTTMASGRPLPQVGKRAEALYDFQGQDSTELSFRKGDIIMCFKQNGDWYNAELNGVKGLVPENHIRFL